MTVKHQNHLIGYITEDVIQIEEKYVPTHTVENVMNVIMCTNNNTPIKIDYGDRRIVIVKTGSRHAEKTEENYDYWETLCYPLNNIKNEKEKFFNHLMTFFMNRNIKDYNPRKIPNTEEKDIATITTSSKIEQIICYYYDKLCDGIPKSDFYHDIIYNSFLGTSITD